MNDCEFFKLVIDVNLFENENIFEVLIRVLWIMNHLNKIGY